MESGPAGAAQMARDLVEKVTGHPAAEVSCPWFGFYDADVSAIAAAHEFWPSIETWLGADPEWWLVEGTLIYHRALEATRSDVIETRRPK